MADIDWSYRAEYIYERRGITVEIATEALADPDAVVIDPDYNSKSGRSVRTIGYSGTLRLLVTVLTTVEDGVTYGVNAWPANTKDKRLYEGNE